MALAVSVLFTPSELCNVESQEGGESGSNHLAFVTLDIRVIAGDRWQSVFWEDEIKGSMYFLLLFVQCSAVPAGPPVAASFMVHSLSWEKPTEKA